MPTPISHRLLDRHRIPGIDPIGRHFAVRPDLYLLPEYAIALVGDELARLGGPVISQEKVLVVADHFALPSSIERAEILSRVGEIVRDFGWQDRYEQFTGICHQLLLEDSRLGKTSLVVGADSHTVTAGVTGAWAAGFGSHDLLYALRKDAIWVEYEDAVAIRIVGKGLGEGTDRWLSGKDIILEVFARLGPEGFHRRCLEFFDDTENSLSFEQRVPLSNMVVDGGATNGLFAQEPWEAEPARAQAYESVIEIDVDQLAARVARPHSPFDVVEASEAVGTPITQAYLGSCNSGRLEDFEVAARILRGRKVAPGIKAIAIPSSKQAFLDAMRAGYLEVLLEAGFVIGNPSCGPCGGIDKGILGKADVCIATMNRNFQGRMGSSESEIWLGSAATVAASAVVGSIVTPDRLPPA
ncbi:MAG: 3-isopropylmalate/(R)-2-methylmalate dehydratase large subunit [Hyphomicrobiaceae bacterium]